MPEFDPFDDSPPPGEPPPPKLEPVEKGLPTAPDAERFVLGSILIDETQYVTGCADLRADDFALEKHRRIYRRIGDLAERGEHIDRVTVAHELQRHGELESVDGLSYLVSLDDGLPQSPNIDSYIRIIREKSQLRRIVFVSQNTINRALAGEETPKEIITGVNETLLELENGHEEIGVETPAEIIRGYEGGINTFLDPSRQEIGIETGFSKFDDMTNGLHPGELIIIAARPGTGKSAWALNVAEHVAVRKRKPVVFFSLEVPKHNILRRMMCALARVDQHKFRKGYLSAEERRRCNVALGKITESPFLVSDKSSIIEMDIRSKLLRLIQKYGPLALVIVDYLQLMSSRKKFENRNAEVTQQSRNMKLIAKDLGLPMMVLSQLSRQVEQRGRDHRPRLGDLRDSGSIEQDADLVAFLFREEMYEKSREDCKGKAELIIGKQREGPTGIVKLNYQAPFVRFESSEEDLPAFDE